MDIITGFEPIVGENPKVLILGTMPSIKSLERREYYGHGRNQFWRIMGDLFGFDKENDYEYRKKKIVAEGIALWDVVKSCERKGSLDKDIRNAAYNDIAGFIQAHPTIRVVILNGGKARDIYRREYSQHLPDMPTMDFYSTSPANAISYERKFEQWRKLMEYC